MESKFVLSLNRMEFYSLLNVANMAIGVVLVVLAFGFLLLGNEEE